MEDSQMYFLATVYFAGIIVLAEPKYIVVPTFLMLIYAIGVFVTLFMEKKPKRRRRKPRRKK